MAGTEDYSFYYSLENSPFWIKKADSAASAVTDGRIQHENKAITSPKYRYDDMVDSSRIPNPSFGIMRLAAENLLCHPFLVLRRQCQVNVFSRKYHTLPFSLVPVVIRLHQRQSMTVLWKGIGSALIVRGLTLAIEDVLSKITPWPKEIDRNSSLKAIGHHILLKSVSLAVVIPFYAASVVETVQSDIASEKPGIFDVFQEGIYRFLSWSAPQTGRLLPIWIILCPAVLCGTVHYIVSVLSAGLTRWGMTSAKKSKQRKQGALSKEVSFVEANDLDLSSRFAGSLVADVILFPFETVLHRLHIQGTRTIIDNLDTGASVIPILTRYDGFFDCWNTITREEGRWGLYKGLGALVLQYALQLSIIKGSLFTFYHMGDLFKPNPGIQPVSPRNQTVLSDRQDRSPKASPELPRGYPLHQQFN
ncbi:solute carrier family 25 member 46-like isoform X1 [Daphnia pulicaria]|uniref:solute carrier family 25 member 46-like isoform X1 n=2 Tax=Daphnia pulicaria TaxID=35523 RepID=UPI001EECB45A|nr:solute carrier family 25 member 46-like isoform X1 [Daphnia pulicaria]